MRFSASASVFFATSAVLGSCTVYDSDLRPADGASSGNSDGSGDAGRGGASLGGTSGGSTPESAGKSGSVGQAASAGTDAIAEGGRGEAGAGGDAAGAGGSGGASAAGGAAAVGGSAGAGSGTGGTGASSGAGGGGGSGGGGAPPVLCGAHPLTPKATWTATASKSSPGNGMESDPLYNPPSHMLDGSNVERWSTGSKQTGVMEWIQIDFKAIVSLKRIDLRLLSDEGGNGGDYPRAYTVRMTNIDGDATGPVLASGAGTPNSNLAVTFTNPVTGQFLLIHQTGVAEDGLAWWTVAELSVSCTD